MKGRGCLFLDPQVAPEVYPLPLGPSDLRRRRINKNEADRTRHEPQSWTLSRGMDGKPGRFGNDAGIDRQDWNLASRPVESCVRRMVEGASFSAGLGPDTPSFWSCLDFARPASYLFQIRVRSSVDFAIDQTL